MFFDDISRVLKYISRKSKQYVSFELFAMTHKMLSKATLSCWCCYYSCRIVFLVVFCRPVDYQRVCKMERRNYKCLRKKEFPMLHV